jgi:hypothetical protein
MSDVSALDPKPKPKDASIDVQKVLALWVPITFIVHVAVWSFVPIPNIGNDKIVGMLQAMLGGHMAWAGMIIGYYFNSSASSAKKDDIIARSTPVEAARDIAAAAAIAESPKSEAVRLPR